MTDFDSDRRTPDAGSQPTERLQTLPGHLVAPESPEPNDLSSPTSDQIDPLLGMLIDSRYRVIHLLARGGMATVYVAQDERLERPVALKIMHPHLAQSQDYVARFRREARSAARIIHPGVVSVFDQGVVAGQGFLVMELIDGPNLRTVLNEQGSFTVGQTLSYVHDVLDALRAAHRVGVIHRDIKPENVLVPADPPARVTDFGLARAASEVSLSTTGSMLGTVAYIAPEVALSHDVDQRTDLYAVGIMAFEMLTGSVPWEGENAIQIATHHVNDPIPMPSTLVSWLPREIDDFISALAATNPDERPTDAGEALELLARVEIGLPEEILTRRADVAPKVASSAGETATWEHLGVTSSLPPNGHSTSRTVVQAAGVQGAMHSPKKNRRSFIGKFLAIIAFVAIIGGVGGWWWWNEYGPGSYLTMPQTAGRSSQAVKSELAALGLGVIEEEAFSDTVQSGIVISSDPDGGQPVHKNAEVRVTTSKGIDMRAVPDLVGKNKSEIESLLIDAGLAVGTINEEYSEEVAKDIVISQSLDPDTSIPHDTKIDVVVSKGREPLTVPDLMAMSSADAQAAIEALGLVASPSEEYSDSVAEGSLISQTTAAGTTLYKGDKVEYVVSKGPETVEVPSITGKQEAEAKRILEAAGLNVTVQRVLGGVFGTARYTDPDAGTVVKKGSTVTLFIV